MARPAPSDTRACPLTTTLAHVPHQTGEHTPALDFLRSARLVVVAGKGGVGKTTIAAALGLLAAKRGRRTIVVESGDRRHLAELFGVSP